MRNRYGLLIGTAVLSSLLMPLRPGDATAQTARAVSMEKSLLGVRLLQSYNVVLKKYGQPTRVYSLGQGVGLDYALNSKGSVTGGIKNVYDLGGAGGGGGLGSGAGPSLAGAGGSPFGGGRGPMAAGMSGPGSGGPMTGPPMGVGGGSPFGGGSPYGAMMGGARGGGKMGAMGAGGPGSGGGSPFSGMMGGPPGLMGAGGPRAAGASSAGGGMMGSAGGATGQGTPTFADAGGFYWVYTYPRKEVVNMFYFNKDGRCIAIAHMGQKDAQATRKGVMLGTPVRSVYSLYGWPNSTEPQEQGIMSMFYNEKHHVQFDMLNNRVVGIAITLSENMKISRGGGGAGGAGGGAGRLAGGPPGMGNIGGGGGKIGGGGGGSAASALE